VTNKSWIGEGESPRTMVRRRRFEPKNLFSIFFNSNGPVLIHCVNEGETIDHNYYIENCLKPVVKEIWKQRRSNGTKGIKLLHDNGPPHRHSDVINYLTEEGIIIMPHPPYSPDLAPCDYWLNDYIKRNLTDQPDEKSLARAVSKIIKDIPEEEFKKTFDKLLERMELCINNHGDYFEHLMK
jgi:histone-lysine N-methyltransferase SETMAR